MATIAVAQRLGAFFCSPAEPLNLAVFRIVVFTCLLRTLHHTDYVHLAEMPAALRVAPHGYEHVWQWIPFDLAWVVGVRRVALVAGCAALIGWMTRSAAAVTCVCAVYLLGLPGWFGKINHVNHHLVWFSALLAAAPSGDALGIDAVHAAWRRADRADLAPPSAGAAYALPIRVAWLLIGVIYFFPGMWKLLACPAWLDSDSMRYLMYEHWASKHFLPAVRIDRYPLLCSLGGLATIVFELSFVFTLLFPWLRRLAVLGGIAFHWLTKVYLQIFFRNLLVCYAVFVDWQWLGARIGARLFARDAVLTFDPDDPRHRRIVALLLSLDLLRRLQCRPNSPATDRSDGKLMRVHVDGQTLSRGRNLLAIGLRIPLAVAAWPVFVATWIVAPSGDAAALRAGDASVKTPRLAPILTVGGLLLAANIYCGAMCINSWPFSVYPTFAQLHGPTQTVIEAVTRQPNGRTHRMQVPIHSHAQHRILEQLPAERAAALQGLADLLASEPRKVRPGDVLQLYEVTRSIVPEERSRSPLREQLLAEFRFGDSVPAHAEPLR